MDDGQRRPPDAINELSGSGESSGVLRYPNLADPPDRTDMHFSGSRSQANEDFRDKANQHQELAPRRAAPAAFLHHPRHHGRRRLCLAEGRQLAGGAARSLDPGRGYPPISRGGKRLHRKPARPHRLACRRRWSRKCAGASRKTIPACRRRMVHSPICRKFRDGGQHEMFGRMPRDGGETEIVLDGDALAADHDYFRFGGSRHSPDHRLVGLERRHQGIGIFFDSRARLDDQRRPSTTWSRKPTARWCGARIPRPSSM